MARNVNGEKFIAVRIIPRLMKDIYMNYKHNELGEKPCSGSLSNLGIVDLPPEIAVHVDYFDFIPAPAPATKCNCSVISFQDKISISFGRTIYETEIEKYFFNRLIKFGVPVKVISN